MGFSVAVMDLDTIMHAAKAIEAVLTDMKTGTFAKRQDGMEFERYKTIVDYSDWEALDTRFSQSISS
jgi:hypothetical protein